jgi:hypothetical protein
MVCITVGDFAARKPATALIPVVEGSADGRGNGSGFATDVEDVALAVVQHLDRGGVTGDAAGRFRGNALAVLESGLALVSRHARGEGGGVDVDHNLVAVAAGAGVEVVSEGGLGDEAEGVGPPLSAGGVVPADFLARFLPAVVEALFSSVEGPEEDSADFRGEATTNDHHPIFVDPGRETPASGTYSTRLARHITDPTRSNGPQHLLQLRLQINPTTPKVYTYVLETRASSQSSLHPLNAHGLQDYP